jgi:hypothetical protein
MSTRWTIGLFLLALAVIYPLGELTQNRPDAVPPGSTTVIEYHVITRGYDPELAAIGLWATCQQTVEHVRSHHPPEQIGDGSYSVVVAPGLGEHDQRRLEGCLEDATIDRVSATVTRFELMAPA